MVASQGHGSHYFVMKNREFKLNAVDWLASPGLSMASPAARGVWIDLLCGMWLSDRPGYLILRENGPAPSISQIAKMCRTTVPVARDCIAELIHYGVLSTSPEGVIFSRRMISDVVAMEKAVKNGRKGGNPRLKSKR